MLGLSFRKLAKVMFWPATKAERHGSRVPGYLKHCHHREQCWEVPLAMGPGGRRSANRHRRWHGQTDKAEWAGEATNRSTHATKNNEVEYGKAITHWVVQQH